MRKLVMWTSRTRMWGPTEPHYGTLGRQHAASTMRMHTYPDSIRDARVRG